MQLNLSTNGAQPQPDEAWRLQLPIQGQAHAGPAVSVADRHHSLRRGIV